MDTLSLKRVSFGNVEFVCACHPSGITVSYRLVLGYTDERKVYSVLISRYDGIYPTEEEFLFDISSDDGEALRIFRSLYENCVLPDTVYECIDSLFDIV